MSRKITLIMPPNNDDLNSYLKPDWSLCRIPPIGLLSIASYLKSKYFSVNIIDCRELITKYRSSDYISYLMHEDKLNADVIGINFLTANFNHVKLIADEIKKCYPNKIIIVGGVHPSVEPDLTFKQISSIDAICVGAGEEVSLEVAQGTDLDKIKGLYVRGKPFVSREPEVDIDKYPLPDYSLVNRDWYTHFSTYTISGFGFKGISALTSRSCPNSCKFCSSDWSKPFKYHSPEYVIKLAKYLTEFDIDNIVFFDDTIGIKEDRLVQICECFINEKLFYPNTNIRWAGDLRANQVKPALLNLMIRAGCYNVAIGCESGSDRMLKEINKHTTVEMNRQACRYVKESGLHLGLSFMMGIPTETEDDMIQTIKFMKEINCNYMGIGTFRPLPGSKYFNELIKDKENVDWVNLGNFMALPKYKFYDCDDNTFLKLYDEAYNYSYGRQWLALHNDVVNKYPTLTKDIASNIKTKICYSNRYNSDHHKSFNQSKILLFRNSMESFYIKLPYGIRKPLKTLVKKLASKLNLKILWRYR